MNDAFISLAIRRGPDGLPENVSADRPVGVVPEHVFPSGLGHRPQLLFIGERGLDHGREPSPGRFVEEAVDTLFHLPVPGDPGPVDDGNRTAGGRFIVPETIPTQSLGRPGQPGTGAAFVIFLPGEQDRRHIDLDPEALELEEFGKAAAPDF